jgi:putative transcriptional regulator
MIFWKGRKDKGLKGEEEGWLTGQILAATPMIQDGIFAHGLILVCEHFKDGAMGLLVNKELRNINKFDVLTKMGLKVEPEDAAEIRMCVGGPLDASRGFLLHSDDYKMEGTVNYGNGICVTSEKQVLIDYFAGNGPKKLILALGYSGWVTGQLDEEIRENSWLTLPANSKLLFDTDNDSKWQKACAEQGIDIYNLSTTSGSA